MGLDSIKAGWKKGQEKVVKRGGVPSRQKEWPVSALFSNQEVDEYLHCIKEWSGRCVWFCGEGSVGFVTNYTPYPHLTMTTLIGSDLER